MEKLHLPAWAGKLPRLIGCSIGPRTETCVNWDGSIAMIPGLHQGNVYIKRNLRVWKAQKSIQLVGAETLLTEYTKYTDGYGEARNVLVGAETPLTCADRQTTPTHGGRYGAKNRLLHKLGWTYRHGTVFAPRQCLYQKERAGMESPEMYSTCRCRNPTYLC